MTYLGTRLKYLRKLENETQQQLADSLKISKSTVSMYENGQREPDFETLEAIADHYNVDIRTFFPNSAPPVSDEDPQLAAAKREIDSMLSDMTLEELALVKVRLSKIKESR